MNNSQVFEEASVSSLGPSKNVACDGGRFFAYVLLFRFVTRQNERKMFTFFINLQIKI